MEWIHNILNTVVISVLYNLWLADPECGDVPLLTPGSKEMMSQALKATFSGFTKEQQRLGIPKGTAVWILISPFKHKWNLLGKDTHSLLKIWRIH